MAVRRALIVASGEYEHAGLGRLLSPAADAGALADVLARPDIGGFEVETLTDQPHHDVQARIEDLFADARGDDVLLLHFSGHGLKNESGQLYFAARNTKPNRLASTAIPADFVQRCMGASRSRSIVLFLDCCYGGAFGQGVAVRAAGDVNLLDSFPSARLGGGRGRAVISASNAVEYAFEGENLRETADVAPSHFTAAVVRGLATGEADRDGDGWIALDELYDYVFDEVRAATPHQTPTRSIDMQGELYLARSVRGTVVPPPAEPAAVQPVVETAAEAEPRTETVDGDDGRNKRAQPADERIEEPVAEPGAGRIGRRTADPGRPPSPQHLLRFLGPVQWAVLAGPVAMIAILTQHWVDWKTPFDLGWDDPSYAVAKPELLVTTGILVVAGLLVLTAPRSPITIGLAAGAGLNLFWLALFQLVESDYPQLGCWLGLATGATLVLAGGLWVYLQALGARTGDVRDPPMHLNHRGRGAIGLAVVVGAQVAENLGSPAGLQVAVDLGVLALAAAFVVPFALPQSVRRGALGLFTTVAFVSLTTVANLLIRFPHDLGLGDGAVARLALDAVVAAGMWIALGPRSGPAPSRSSPGRVR